MTSPDAQRVVIGCMVGVAAVGASKAIVRGEWPRGRVAIGAGIAGVALAAAAGPAPDFAAGLAGLALAGALIIESDSIGALASSLRR